MLLRTLLLLTLLGSATTAGELVLVARGATWRYLDDGSDQGSAWKEPGFVDAAWAMGPAELGYGDGDEATVVSFGPSSSNKYATTWFRHSFDVANPGLYTSLELRTLVDDGAVAYLNGTEVARYNMDGGGVSYTTLAASTISGMEEGLVYPHPIDASLLVAGTNVLAIEVHQRTLSSSDLSLDVELIGYDQLTMLRRPYLQRVAASEVTVRWRTDVPSATHLEYGPAPGPLGTSIDDPALVVDHEVRIQGLSPDSTYQYAVGDGAGLFVGDGPDHRFTTAPVPGADRPFRAWVLGDSGTADTNAAAVRDAYLAYAGTTPTDLVLMLGDNAYVVGADYEYQAAVFDMYPDVLRQSPLFPTRGNHDEIATVYFGSFTLPAAGECGGVPSGTEAYYSFDWANVHFVCLDSEGSNKLSNGPMALWLQADLAATEQDWIVAFWHHAPYSKGSHDSDTETDLVQMRRNLVPILEAGGVDLVLCGHSHSYERSHLIDGHHGLSTTYDPVLHEKDPGTGDPSTDGPYFKAVIPEAGTVYTVAGSSGKLTDGPLDHPAMLTSTMTLGSVVIDVDAQRMDVRFLSATGVVMDSFTLRTYPDAGLLADTTSLSVSTGGTQAFDLDAGALLAGQPYLLLGSLAGDLPGLVFDGQLLPLNFDAYTRYTLTNPNTPAHPGSFGILDGAGAAQAAFALPAGLNPILIGLTAHHAALVFELPIGVVAFTSGAMPTTFLP